MRFSISIVFRPVSYGDMLLMDGGITNPLPLNRVKRTEGDILVSFNVTAPLEQTATTSQTDKQPIPQLVANLLQKGQRLTQLNYVSILMRITDIMLVQNAELMKLHCQPQMSVEMAKNHYGSYDYDRADEMIAYGYQLMNNEIDRYEAKNS